MAVADAVRPLNAEFLPKAWHGIRGVKALLAYLETASAVKLSRKRSRYWIRCMRGIAVGVARGYRFRWFVLTESDEALFLGLSFDGEFHRFIRWLRYYCSDFQYIVVEHMQGSPSVVTGLPRRNWHILSYGTDKLPLELMRGYWKSHFLSTVTGMAEVRDIQAAAKYLAGYLSAEHKFVRSWTSQGWVFSGWVSVSHDFKRVYGHYPAERELVTLALMSPASRSADSLCLLASLEADYYRGLGELFEGG